MVDEGESSGISKVCQLSGYSRENTVEEKRRMKNTLHTYLDSFYALHSSFGWFNHYFSIFSTMEV